MSQATSIGFIGLGQMGFGMARNLLVAGYDVLAYDVVPATLERFTAQGGRHRLRHTSAPNAKRYSSWW